MNQYVKDMEGERSVNVRLVPSKKSLKRRRRRRRRAAKWLTALLLVILLTAIGIYYTGQYLRDQEYLRYPLRHEELIVLNADEFSLEPWHVAAVVRCESSFREGATSEAGARGLMQIMPDTGKWISGKFDEKSIYNDDMLYQPETNLKYGCWYLRWLMERYSQDRTLATAAYHAGHGTVDKWLANPEISPDGKTLANIPYASTRTYVERVLTACEKYQELYDFEEIQREVFAQNQ